MDIKNIPEALKQRQQWILCDSTKQPFTTQGSAASSTDSNTWSTFNAVVNALERSNGRFVNIAYVFSEEDPYVGIDLDTKEEKDGFQCMHDGGILGMLTDEAKTIISSMNSYTEYSRSGTGIHIVVQAKKPGDACKRGNNPNFEMYEKGRYFIVTGEHLPGTPLTIEPRQMELTGLYNHFLGVPTSGNREKGLEQHVPKSPKTEDSIILSIARSAKNGEKFCDLFDRGDVHKYHGGDDSSADQGLCNMLSFYTQDPEQIDRLFRQSALMRDKWERADYSFGRTIPKAIEQTVKSGFWYSGQSFSEFVEDWMSGLAKTQKGQIRNTNNNLRLFVENELSPRLNIFAQELVSIDGRVMRDRDGAAFSADLSKKYWVEFNNSRTLDAMINFATEFHPVRDYLNGLKWDGIKRAETIFIDWLGAEDIPGYTRVVTTQFLKGMVKRIFEPGCELQEILVLVGPQGCYKSNILRDISKGWFLDSLRSTDTKIVGEETAGCWVVELAEFRLFDGMKEEAKKEFLSRRAEKYRAAYARLAGTYQRQFVLAGTTNKQEFLGDYTGDRRYMPIRCGSKKMIAAIAPWDHFAKEVDQILAEVMVWYRLDPRVGIPPEKWDLFDAAREDFRYDNKYSDRVVEAVQKAGNPERISVEWLARILNVYLDDRKEKATLHDAIQRMGGYSQIGKVVKIDGKPTRNGWERLKNA